MNPLTVSINTDIGEGYGVWGFGSEGVADEAALMDQVTAANVACGFHAGDPDILRRTCDMAAARGVSVGAHVSYHDLVGFGRRFIDVPTATLTNDIVYQIGALQAFARVAGTTVTYVKAHGALYNATARHVDHAAALVEAVTLVDAGLPIVCQGDTVLWDHAERSGLRPVAEVFIDRGYTDDGLLVPRNHPQALIVDPSTAARRALRMAMTGVVDSVDGNPTVVVPDGVQTIAMCVHGDTPGAASIAEATRCLLVEHDIPLIPIGLVSHHV